VSRPYRPDPSGKITFEWVVRQFYSISRALRGPDTYSPAQVTLTVGTSSDTVDDVRTLSDGNVYDLTEATGDPAQDVKFTFEKVGTLRALAVRAYYSGAATHYVEVGLYNYNTSSYDTFMTYSDGFGYNYRYVEIPDADNYHSNGQAIVRFYHPESGVGTHHSYIDYVALTE
jgi:hypothetical protein